MSIGWLLIALGFLGWFWGRDMLTVGLLVSKDVVEIGLLAVLVYLGLKVEATRVVGTHARLAPVSQKFIAECRRLEALEPTPDLGDNPFANLR
jgi:hypothetical protein